MALLAGASPAAPLVPVKPIPKPAPEPAPSHPEPRRIPVPVPETPKQIPARPVEDPKDIQPEDLYSSDAKVAPFWNEMPVGLRKLMIEGAREERAALETHMKERYGNAQADTLMREVVKLQSEIERIEEAHKAQILAVIRKMIDGRYGDLATGLKIGITDQKPSPREAPEQETRPRLLAAIGRHFGGQAETPRMIPELPASWDSGMVYRTELRNLWQQGEGWIGMKEFAYGHAKDLDAVAPGLASKYQELDRLYRYGQLAQLELIPVPEFVDHLPKEAISAGREIVTTDFEMVKGEGGQDFMQVKEIKGIAVGRNGWAAAHEARKAAAQMATPMEAAYRWMLPPERREHLNSATNSARAEIRQGVFGPAVVRAMRKRLALLYSQGSSSQLEDPQYHHMVDGLFSLPPDTFKYASRLLFDSEFEVSSEKREEARKFLAQNGIFPARNRE